MCWLWTSFFRRKRRFLPEQVFLDDIVLVERGGPLNIDAAPLRMLVDRMARRQWDGLWAARQPRTG